MSPPAAEPLVAAPSGEEARAPSPSGFGPGTWIALLGLAWVGLLWLVLRGTPHPAPGLITPESLTRNLLGLAVVCFLPGVPVALLVYRHEGAPGGPGGLDPVPFALQAFIASTFAAAVNFTTLKLAGLTVTAPPLLLLVGVETLVFSLLARSAIRHGRFRALSWGMVLGLLLSAGILGGWAWTSRPMLTPDLSHYFFSHVLDRGDVEPVNLGGMGLSLVPEGGWPTRPGSPTPYRPGMALRIENSGSVTRTLPLWVLWRGPVGTKAALERSGKEVASAEVVRRIAENEREGPVERYWDWGIAELRADLEVPPGGVRVDLEATGFDDAEGGRWPREQAQVYDLINVDLEVLAPALPKLGLRPMHYYQLLNVAENVRWADEYTRDLYVTLNQPPLWSYVYAPIRVLMGPHLFSVRLFFLLMLLGTVAVSARLVETEAGSVPALALVPLALVAASHGRLMDGNGSVNFPDNLFAFAVLASVLFAVRDQVRSFASWSFAATLLRYPGSTVVTFVLAGLALFYRGRRRSVGRLAVAMWGSIGLFCLSMVVGGAWTGQLGEWLDVLFFETVPEHFSNNAQPLPVWMRPFEFLKELAFFSGLLLPFALLRPGRLARLALFVTFCYFPFLAFVDHFSHHYYLPMLPLVAVAAVTCALKVESRLLRHGLVAVQGVAAASALYLTTAWNW